MKGINKGNKNGLWKGDKVQFCALHAWIRRHKPKPEFCVCCKKVAPYDLANISGEYKRDVNDFEWLCRRCHMKKDNRLKKLRQCNENKKTTKEDKINHKKEYYQKNKESIIKKANDYYIQNKEKRKKYMKEYYQRNKKDLKEKRKKYMKEYYQRRK